MYSISVFSTSKPCSVVIAAEAIVEVTGGPVPAGEVVDAGLAALHESRESLFGCGIRGHASDEVLPAGTYTVYANRD